MTKLLTALIVLHAVILHSAEKLSITALDINSTMNTIKSRSWVAEDNDLFEKYFSGSSETRFGLNLNTNRIKNVNLTDVVDSTLPLKIDWRNFAGQNWISPVKHQMKCGSCVAFAAAGVVEAHYNIMAQSYDHNIDISEQYLFTCGGGNCTRGWFPTTGLHYMKNEGVTDEACAPYKIGNNREDLACSLACSDSKSRLFKIKDYAPAGSWAGSTNQDIKRTLLKGPVTASMMVYEDFMLYKSGVYSRIKGKLLGGHSVVVVGYDEVGKYFIVKNSWGADWGEEGYFRIAYDADCVFGDLSYQPTLHEISGVIKLSNPSYRDILSGNVEIGVSSTYKNLKNVSAAIFVHNSPAQLASLPLNLSMRGEFDSRVFDDGTYDIYIEGETQTGETVRSEYSSFFVLNYEPRISLSFEKLFEGDKVPEMPMFELKCENDKVELTSFTFFIKGPGLDRAITKPYPCPVQRIKLSSKDYEKGQFIVSAKGFVGDKEVIINNSFKLQK